MLCQHTQRLCCDPARRNNRRGDQQHYHSSPVHEMLRKCVKYMEKRKRRLGLSAIFCTCHQGSPWRFRVASAAQNDHQLEEL